MSITLEELASRLTAEAGRRGITVDALADELIDTLPPARRKLGFVGLGSSTSSRDSADVDEMLAEGYWRP
jgi:hypothetical protein